ncbi:MAG: hypothetical protein ACM31C_27445 [Acidobacteriota bacterium]
MLGTHRPGPKLSRVYDAAPFIFFARERGTGRDVLGRGAGDYRSQVSGAADPPDLALAVRRPRRGEREALGEQREEDVAQVAAVGERGAEIAQTCAGGRLDLSDQRRDLVGRSLRGEHLRFEARDRLIPLAQLRR